MRRLSLSVLAVALILPAGCGADPSSRPTGAGPAALDVVVAFYPLVEVVEAVGGARVEVSNVTPPGTEPHDVELTPDQVDRILDADLVVYLGAGFQPAVEELAGRTRGEALDVLEGLSLMEASGELHAGEPHEGEEPDEHAGEAAELDPHVWLDPQLMRRIVDRVATTLSTLDPAGEAAFEQRAAAYGARLEELDELFETTLAECERRVLVTSHAAFGYLTRRYGLTQEAVAGLSPESEPDPRRLAELVDLVKATGATTVFYDALGPSRIAETLARETGATPAVINPLEGLTADELAAGETYLSVMEDNLDAIAAGLGCRRPSEPR